MQHCRTITLTDEPEEIDAFSGPHQRIADAVAQLIQPEDAKGISIGIEGSWGSGKSTVARLLTNRLEADTNITVISFDAWAHEGDPLRRTFLETIIRKLQKRKWVDEKTWDECIEELANRREVVKTKDSLTITPSGKLIAFILLLVPIGSAFITAALRENITLLPGALAWTFLIYISIGVALTFIPLAVLFRKIKHEPDIVAFLFNKGPTEKTTETSKTANPTSIEFEDSFQRLFKEALEGDPASKEDLKKDQRRVVLILDNLDRIDSKDALVIWSTLQTFLQHKGASRPDWHERLWLLVLYDISGLSKLWSNNNNEAAISFIDKSFQIRFEVPALVLSDWRHFLITQLEKAFPDHSESDFHEVYRILALWIAQRNKHLTIRELKLFVNQIGAVHRQWAGADPASDTFPLALTAYYALLSRHGGQIIVSLYNPDFPEKQYQELLGRAVRENLAALAFNVEVDVAQQLLFSDKIKNALTLGDKDELARVASLLRRGFWEVFEEVAKDWTSTESVKLADAAFAIEESGILSTGFGPSAQSVTKYFCERATSVDAWSPMDEKRAKGIATLIKWKKELRGSEQHNEQFIDTLSKALALGLFHVDFKLSAKEWLDQLLFVLKQIEPATEQRSLATIVDTIIKRFKLIGALSTYHVPITFEVYVICMNDPS